MRKLIALLLVPGTALARDHDAQTGLGVAILMTIGVVVWVVGAAIFKAVFGKKPVEGAKEPPSTHGVNPDGK